MQRLEEVALRDGTEDADSHTRDDQSTQDGLDEDGILYLAQSRLLDPDFAIEDFANNVALLIPGNPWLVFPRVA